MEENKKIDYMIGRLMMLKVLKTVDHGQTRIQRGWGHEVWIENCDLYCGKKLVLKAGKRSSLHFHVDKTETMYLQSGRVDLKMIDPTTGKSYIVELFPGDSLKLRPGQVHQMIAIEDSELFEFSTKHDENDSYRVEKGD